MPPRILLPVLLALASPASSPAAIPDRPPNVLLIFSDDQGYDDVSCFGGSIPTPNLDRMAAEGVRFTDFYVALPVCTPSRFSLLTGKLPNRSRDQLLGPLMFAEGPDLRRGLHAGETTLATVLRRRNYRTALMGKWHLGHGNAGFLPTRHGFDEFYGHTGGCIDYFTMDYGNRPSWYVGETLKSEKGYATELLTDAAIRYIEGQDRERPFFLYLAYNAPHFAKAWDTEKQDFAHELQAKPEDLRVFSHWKNRDRQVYAAMVKAMDDGIGEVLAALDRTGLAQDTLVWFICDNGADPKYGGSNLPLRGTKHTLWEGGIRVPAILRWKGTVPPGQVISQVASALDVMPTCARLAGLPAGELEVDGRDLVPVLFGAQAFPRDLYFNRGFDAAFRRGPWKMVRDRDAEPALYHLEKDPAETTDLAARHPEKLRELLEAHAAVSRTHPSADLDPFQEKHGPAAGN